MNDVNSAIRARLAGIVACHVGSGHPAIGALRAAEGHTTALCSRSVRTTVGAHSAARVERVRRRDVARRPAAPLEAHACASAR
jgi:hypothetical protein